MSYKADPGRVIRLENQNLLAQLDAESDASIPKVAAGWSAGLGAILTATGAAAWIGGPSLFASIDDSFRTVAMVAAALGVVLQVLALWLLLGASAGSLGILRAADFDETRTVRMHLDEVRAANLTRIARGRRVGVLSLVLVFLALFSAMLGWNSASRLSVKTDKAAYCGVVRSADNQKIVLDIAGRSVPVTIPFADVVTLDPVSAC